MIIMMITATASATITLKAAKKTKITKKTNEKAVFKEKLEAQLQEVWKEKHTNFVNLKTYEEQADQKPHVPIPPLL